MLRTYTRTRVSVHILMYSLIRSDGTLAGWGFTANAVPPPGLSSVTAIAMGEMQSLALKADGTVVAWPAYTNFPAGLSNVMAISVGYDHALALLSNGTVVAWDDGYAEDGQATVPAGLNSVVAIAAGGLHSLGLKSDGTVVAWGAGQTTGNYPHYGQSIVPTGLKNVVAIAAGGFFSLAASGEQSMAISAPLRTLSIGLVNLSPTLRFQTFAGRHYAVQQSLPLTPGSWTDLPGSPLAGNGQIVVVTDTNALTLAPRRFYRVKELP